MIELTYDDKPLLIFVDKIASVHKLNAEESQIVLTTGDAYHIPVPYEEILEMLGRPTVEEIKELREQTGVSLRTAEAMLRRR